MKTKIALAVMALAMVCLSLAPAMAAPFDGNKDRCNDRCNGSLEKGGFGGHNDWMLLVDDATRANFDNMTLNQFKELREAKIAELDNMTVAQIDELHKKQMEKLGNMTLAQIREMRMDRMGGMGPGMMDDGMMQNGRAGPGMNGPGMNGNGAMGQDNGPAKGGR
jgi:hypothetical protein